MEREKGITVEKLERLAAQAGFARFQVIPSHRVSFSQEVRRLCEQNACGQYGKSWACPPGVGTVEECKARCLAFTHVLVFSNFYPLEDSFDYEGMQRGHREFAKACREFSRLLPRGMREHSVLLSNEGCAHCAQCTYPDAPCRFPQELSPSVESYGIWVNLLAKEAGIPYHNGKDTVTYFGGIFFTPAADPPSPQPCQGKV